NGDDDVVNSVVGWYVNEDEDDGVEEMMELWWVGGVRIGWWGWRSAEVIMDRCGGWLMVLECAAVKIEAMMVMAAGGGGGEWQRVVSALSSKVNAAGLNC
ncbi:hypothetical protein Tco_1367086, partial [Tanacetum coccineum]